MSEYYAEHESIEEVSNQVAGTANGLSENAEEIGASAKVISRSQTLEAFGYSNLTSRTQASAEKLSRKVKKISNVLTTVSGLYADYEGRVIAALDESVSAGNNFTADSRHHTRIVIDIIGPGRGLPEGGPAIRDVTPFVDGEISTPGTLTPEQKRRYVLDWLEKNHPELLEQIYDKLHGGQGVAAAAVTAGVIGGVGGIGGIGAMTGGTQGTQGMMSGNGGQQGAQQGQGAGAAGNGAMDGAGASTSGLGASDGGFDGGSADGGGAEGSGAAGAGGADSGEGWVDDMLNDAVDADQAQAALQAEQAMTQATNTQNPGATSTGAGAMENSSTLDPIADAGSGFSQFMDRLGSGFVAAVQQYGLNAGILVGGVGVAYASSGAAVEVVAHCAEFVALKCVPKVQGFMQQASMSANITRITLRAAISNILPGVGGLSA